MFANPPRRRWWWRRRFFSSSSSSLLQLHPLLPLRLSLSRFLPNMSTAFL
jgi:hypothetical protein